MQYKVYNKIFEETCPTNQLSNRLVTQIDYDFRFGPKTLVIESLLKLRSMQKLVFTSTGRSLSSVTLPVYLPHPTENRELNDQYDMGHIRIKNNLINNFRP